MKQMEVTILGQSYILACPDGGEASLLAAVASVDTEMSAIRDAGKVKARERIAVLAALNLAYQLAERPAAAPAPGPANAAARASSDSVQIDTMLARIDAALNDSLLIPSIVKKTKLPLKPGAPVGELEKSGIPFAKNNPKFKTAIDKALADLRADGSFAKISNKWFDRDVSKPPVAK